MFPKIGSDIHTENLFVLLLNHQQLELYYESWKNVSNVRCTDLSSVQYKCEVTWNATEQEPTAARMKRATSDPLSSFLDDNLDGVLIDKAKQNNITAPVIINNSSTVSTSTETVTNSTGNQAMTTDVSIKTQESTTGMLTTLPSTSKDSTTDSSKTAISTSNPQTNTTMELTSKSPSDLKLSSSTQSESTTNTAPKSTFTTSSFISTQKTTDSSITQPSTDNLTSWPTTVKSTTGISSEITSTMSGKVSIFKLVLTAMPND